jgi:carboxylate-amine ligase
VIEQRFGSQPPLTLGVEEELVILDAESLEQVAEVGMLLAALDGRELPGRAKTELHASVFELNTDPLPNAKDAFVLRDLRAAAAEAAGSVGLAIAATGTHPFARQEQPIVPEERYLTMVSHHGASARRQNVQGLHVHVSMPGPEECWRVLEGMLPWLPVLLALSANSPWLAGELTGMASNRAPVLVELPRTGCPPAFGSYAGWEAWVEQLVQLGVMADYTRIWWDIRPHPGLGTVEIRMPDQPTDVGVSVALAGIVQALAAKLLDAGDVVTTDRGHYQYNRWAAARFGPAAELIAPDGKRTATATELGRELIDWTGAEVELDLERCEGELQLEFDDPRDALADVVARSLA